jgi:hypothetical protein
MTTFKGHKTGFNRGGSNETVPNKGDTVFKGRGSFPAGKMKNADAVADISGSNRRVAKNKHGDGGGMSTTIRGRNAFSKGRK